MEDLLEHIQHFLQGNHFTLQNNIRLESAQPDHASFSLEIQPACCNSYGQVHGGAIYTMADNAAGVAAMSDGRFYVDMQAKRLGAHRDFPASLFFRHLMA